MRITNKLHRGMSIAAAIACVVYILLTIGIQVLVKIAATVTGSTPVVTNYVTLALNILMAVMGIVAMFSGKKNVLSGIMIAIPGAIALINAVTAGFGVGAASGYVRTAMVLGIACNLVLVAARACSAVECFKAGTFSGNMGKILLIVLPVLYLILRVLSVVLSYTQFPNAELAMILPMIIAGCFPVVVECAGIILIGVACSIAVKEPIPAPVNPYPYGYNPYANVPQNNPYNPYANGYNPNAPQNNGYNPYANGYNPNAPQGNNQPPYYNPQNPNNR